MCGLWARTAHLCTEFEGHSFIREIGSRAAGQFVVRGQELPTAYVRAKFEDRSYTRLRNIEGVPKFRNWGTCPRPRPISGQFVVRGHKAASALGSLTAVCAIWYEGIWRYGALPRKRDISRISCTENYNVALSLNDLTATKTKTHQSLP